MGLLRRQEQAKKENFIDTLFPEEGPLRRELYAKHMEFFAAGKQERERAFMGGNRTGKTTSGGGYELALHLSGDYPSWWVGRRFNRPTRTWACGDTGETVREILQPTLFGQPGQMGTGLIRARFITGVRNRRGSPDAIESATIKHASGRGDSTLLLKSYEQGRKAFQGTKQDVILMDEEPPMSVYSEALLRLAATTPEGDDWGSMLLTFTPLMGISEVVLRFLATQDQMDPIPRATRTRQSYVQPSPATPVSPPPSEPRRDLMGEYENPMDALR